MATQTITLQGKKFQLIPIEKGTKPPSGVETIQWTDGKDYLLSPVVTPAPAPTPKVEEKDKVAETKAPVTPAPADHSTPPWVWILGAIGLIAVILLAVMLIRTPLMGGNPAPAPITNPVNNDVLSESTQLDFGSFGSYHAVMDNNRKMFTLGFWNESMVRAGTKNLADLKRDGGTISFAMPADGWINNSAGELLVDNQKWALGNYGENPEEATLVKKGQIVTVIYGPNNDSAGFQLWFK